MQSFQAYILYVNETTKGKRMDGVMMAQESAREFALLTDQEISQLRIKTGKGHRTQNDWTFISELLQDKFVYTAVPVEDDYKRLFSVDGVLKDGGHLLIFTAVEGCKEYLEKYGSARFGYDLSIDSIPFSTVIKVATDHQERVLLDMNYPQTGRIIGYDGLERKLRVVKVKN